MGERGVLSGKENWFSSEEVVRGGWMGGQKPEQALLVAVVSCTGS